MRRLGLALIAGIMAAGLVLSTGEMGCPEGFHLAEAHGGTGQTCIGVVEGVFETRSARITWSN